MLRFRHLPGSELLIARLFGGAVAELRTVFAAGCREVAVLGTVEVCPGVEDGDVFGRLYGGQIFDSVCVALIHGGQSCGYW